MACGLVHKVDGGLARVHHEAVDKLHGLGALAADFARDNDFAAFGAGVHDEAEDAVAGLADGNVVEQLVAEALALGNGAEALVFYTLDKELDTIVGKAKSLLNEGSKLLDATATLAKNPLRARSANDNFCALRRNANFQARIAVLGKLAREKLVQLGIEYTVSDKLASENGSRKKSKVLAFGSQAREGKRAGK